MATASVLLEGLAFGESPRWHDGALWVCDWGAQELLRVRADGTSEVVARVQSFPLCMSRSARRIFETIVRLVLGVVSFFI